VISVYCVHYSDVEVSVVASVCLSVCLFVWIFAVFGLRDE